MVKDLDLQMYSEALSMPASATCFTLRSANATDLGLWKTDGTSAGTMLVKNLGGQSQLVAPKNMTAAGNSCTSKVLVSCGKAMARPAHSDGLRFRTARNGKCRRCAVLHYTMTNLVWAVPNAQMLIKGSGPATLIFESNGRFDDIDSFDQCGRHALLHYL